MDYAAANENLNILHHCKRCGHPFRGRSDKKFCSTLCRNLFNNEKKNGNCIIKVNQILKRNHHILKSVLGDGVMVEIGKQILVELDFNFNYHTHFRKEVDGKQTICCYDYSFRQTSNSCYLICKIKSLPEREALSAHIPNPS